MVKGLILHPIVGNEGQPDQRVLQTFRFVNGDNFYQMFIAFEAHLLAGGIAVRFGDMLRQPTHQCVLAFQLRSRFLKQLADVQNISQTAFAAGGGQHIFRNIALRHDVAQHRHHAPLLPAFAVVGKLFYRLIPEGFTVIQHVDVASGKPEHGTCQRAAQDAFTLGCQHRLQQPEHLLGFERFKHAVAVGEVDRRDGQQRQRIANQRRFLTTAHQHRDVRGSYRPGLVTPMQDGFTANTRTQPVADLCRAVLGHKGLIISDATSLALHQPDVHRWLKITPQLKAQPGIFRGRFDRQERDFTEHEGVVHL